jgi:hypothetical protein
MENRNGLFIAHTRDGWDDFLGILSLCGQNKRNSQKSPAREPRPPDRSSSPMHSPSSSRSPSPSPSRAGSDGRRNSWDGVFNIVPNDLKQEKNHHPKHRPKTHHYPTIGHHWTSELLKHHAKATTKKRDVFVSNPDDSGSDTES